MKMHPRWFQVGRFLVALHLIAGVTATKHLPRNIINTDVAIVGGGASGSYAAVRLREDLGKDIVVIEKQNRLGGHVGTYQNPTTGVPYDFGVHSYLYYQGAQEFFARFNISIVNSTRDRLITKYVDFATGNVTSNYVPPNSTAVAAGLSKYLELCEQYEDMLLPGYWNFPPADQIPSDLLLSFADFTKKYGIEAILPQISAVSGGASGGGGGKIKSTLYVMQAFGAPLARAFVGGGATFVPASHNNSELYRKIENLLGNDVLYSSTVVETRKRGAERIELLVKRPDGSTTLVRAKRLLIAIEPTLDNMGPFALDEQEAAVFSKWIYSTAFATIMDHPSLPANTSLVNIPAAAAPSNYLVRPGLPSIGRFDYMAPSMFRGLIGGNQTETAAGAKAAAQDALDAMINAGTLPAAGEGEKLKFLAFSDHGPMLLHVSTEDIREGFIQAQYALQGHRGTWYTGGAWSVQYTTPLWAFTDTVLPRLVEGL